MTAEVEVTTRAKRQYDTTIHTQRLGKNQTQIPRFESDTVK
jgi:hypothetical protein